MQTIDKRNIYDDAVAYDLLNGTNTADLPFYIGQFPAHSKCVLELGCGTGRLTVPLAKQGFDVTGIDIEETMLNRAREKAALSGTCINWVHGDVRDFDLGRKFDAVIFPANSIAHMLDNRSVEACLGCVRKHLDDDGKFIFQAFNPILHVFTRDTKQRYPVTEYEDPIGKSRVIVTETNIYDRAKQINNITWYYLFSNTGEEIIKTLPLRMYFPQELDSLLQHNGFEIEVKYGGHDCSPFTSECNTQIMVCIKHT